MQRGGDGGGCDVAVEEGGGEGVWECFERAEEAGDYGCEEGGAEGVEFCGVRALDGLLEFEEVACVCGDVFFPCCCAAVLLLEGAVVGGDVETEG